jgi:hypothetical protein
VALVAFSYVKVTDQIFLFEAAIRPSNTWLTRTFAEVRLNRGSPTLVAWLYATPRPFLADFPRTEKRLAAEPQPVTCNFYNLIVHFKFSNCQIQEVLTRRDS